MCMTLSGHTSTLSRLVVQSPGFEASFLRWAKLDFCGQSGCFLTETMMSTIPCLANIIIYRGKTKTRSYYLSHINHEPSRHTLGSRQRVTSPVSSQGAPPAYNLGSKQHRCLQYRGEEGRRAVEPHVVIITLLWKTSPS